MDLGCGPATFNSRVDQTCLRQAIGVREMATHPSHIRRPRLCRGRKGRAAVLGIDRRRFYGGPNWPGRIADYPLVRSNSGANPVLSAYGWRLTIEPAYPAGDRVVRTRPDRFAAALGAFSGRGAIWIPRQRNRDFSDLADRMALARAASMLRALPVLRRGRQRYRHTLSDTPQHPDKRPGTEPHGATCLQMVLFRNGSLVVGDVTLAQKIALETNERHALSVAHRS